MVLQQAHSKSSAVPHSARPRAASPARAIDRARVIAGAGAIALNVGVLLLLLVPASMPTSMPADSRPTLVDLIPERIKPPTPPPVDIVEKIDPPVPVAQPSIRDVMQQPVVEQVVIEEGTLPADEALPEPTASEPNDISPVNDSMHGMQLEYARAPAPPYPRDALVAGLQGTVLLRILVDIDGRPLQVDVQQSSGHRVLDEAARRFVMRRWTFRPAIRNGQPVQAVGVVPIAYDIGR